MDCPGSQDAAHVVPVIHRNGGYKQIGAWFTVGRCSDVRAYPAEVATRWAGRSSKA